MQHSIELCEQVAALSQLFDLYRVELERRLEEVERLLVKALRHLDEFKRRHTDIMHALVNISCTVSFMPTTVTTSSVSGQPQTSPTNGCSDQVHEFRISFFVYK